MLALPRGQQESTVFHRFGLLPFASRFPRNTEFRALKVDGAVATVIELADSFAGLQRVEQVCDFHCVTTWSYRDLHWEGVRFVDFYNEIVLPQAKPEPDATLIEIVGQDGARTGMQLVDMLDVSVMLVDRLNGRPLTIDHGAPIRLIAPKHYGYKSVKHLHRLTFRHPDEGYRVSGFSFMDHPRARVALEERGRGLPGAMFRYLYRPLIRSTARKFAAASAKRNLVSDPAPQPRDRT